MMKWIYFFLLFLGCSPTSENKFPDVSLIKGFDITSDNIHYQYYEKFGFTDACYHIRTCFDVDSLVDISTWNKLPITQKDLQAINSIPNKIDSVRVDKIPIFFIEKNFFADISLKKNEFIKHDSFINEIVFSQGYYRIKDTVFEVYDKEKNIYYQEYHYCQ